MKKKITVLLTGLMCVATVLAGCGGGSSTSDRAYKADAAPAMAMGNEAMAEEAYYDDDVYEYSEEKSTANDFAEDTEAIAATSNRKLIKTVNMTCETREFDKLIDTISAKVDSLGGYMENTNITGNSYGSSTRRDAYIVARIPSKSLDNFVTLIQDKSNVTNKSENAEDVTLQYADVEARKETLKIEQERLNALLEQADTLENIIELEKRLTEVRYELESYESRLRTMDNQIDYSTVNLNVYEVVEYTPEPIEELTFSQRLSREFTEGCIDAFLMIQDFIIGFSSALPRIIVILVILGIIGLIIFLIVKAIIAIVKKAGIKKKDKVKKANKGKPVATVVDEPVVNKTAENGDKDEQKDNK